MILSQALQTTAVRSESRGDRARINGLGLSQQKQQHAEHSSTLPSHANRRSSQDKNAVFPLPCNLTVIRNRSVFSRMLQNDLTETGDGCSYGHWQNKGGSTVIFQTENHN